MIRPIVKQYVNQWWLSSLHYSDIIMSAMASKITSLMIVYSTIYSGTDQRKHQSSASLAFVGGIHRWAVNSPPKGPVTRKCFHLMTSSWIGHVCTAASSEPFTCWFFLERTLLCIFTLPYYLTLNYHRLFHDEDRWEDLCSFHSQYHGCRLSWKHQEPGHQQILLRVSVEYPGPHTGRVNKHVYVYSICIDMCTLSIDHI